MYPQSAEFNVKFRPGFSEFHQQVKAKMCIHVCMHRMNYCRAVLKKKILYTYINIYIYLFIMVFLFVLFLWEGNCPDSL